MVKDHVTRMVETFTAQIPQYEAFGAAVLQYLEQLLSGHVRVHSLSVRVKEPDQLEEKLSRQGKNYTSLSEVTDLVGVRVVTYFGDEVDTVAKLIDTALVVDPDKSVDKRKQFLPDQFGYASVHKICQLPPGRLGPAFAGFFCEVQIRSILQHTWAEIEHDLGYKASFEVPDSLKRRFSILAGLLELADDEFIRLRDELKKSPPPE